MQGEFSLLREAGLPKPTYSHILIPQRTMVLFGMIRLPRPWVPVLVLLAFAWTSLHAQAAELVMFERSGCVWCMRWDRDVGAIYPRTDEGKLAPLRKVNIDRGVPAEFRLSPPVFYSPTFVLMHEGREWGRITGYLGDDAFWGLASKMIGGLPK